jgi:hypothetical protein
MSIVVLIALIPAPASAKLARRRTIKRYTALAAQEVRSVTRQAAFPLFSKAPAFIASVPNDDRDQTSREEKTPRESAGVE